MKFEKTSMLRKDVKKEYKIFKEKSYIAREEGVKVWVRAYMDSPYIEASVSSDDFRRRRGFIYKLDNGVVSHSVIENFTEKLIDNIDEGNRYFPDVFKL